MVSTQERTTNDVRDSVEGVDDATAAAEDMPPSPIEEPAGAVGALVGILTGGFVTAAAGGFIAGVVVGVTIGRRATPPPPRWQVWR